jgi:hypothetical protein
VALPTEVYGSEAQFFAMSGIYLTPTFFVKYYVTTYLMVSLLLGYTPAALIAALFFVQLNPPGYFLIPLVRFSCFNTPGVEL